MTLLSSSDRVPAKGSSPVRSFVENHAQAVDITAMIDRMCRVAADGLLRAHVSRSPDNRSVVGQMNRLLVKERQAEIDDPWFTRPTRARVVMRRSRRRTIGVEHDVGRLDVAMNGSHGVGVGKRVGDLRDQLGRGPRAESALT